MSEKIYIADDEKNIRELIAAFLIQEGFEVSVFENGDSLLKACETNLPDLVILDIMMPELDGLNVCSRLRETNPGLLIMIVSAKDSPLDRATGLTIGCDDYLIKPFLPMELVARVRGLFRRNKAAVPDSDTLKILSFGPLRLYPQQRTAFLLEEPLHLTPTEFEFLSYLIQHQDRAISRDELLQSLWNVNWQSDTRATDDVVKRLRRKLQTKQSPVQIETIWGFGFRIIMNETGDNDEKT